MQAYEYLAGGLSHRCTPEEERNKLNECGAAGWELVSVCERTVNGHSYTMFYFRRPHWAVEENAPEPSFELTG